MPNPKLPQPCTVCGELVTKGQGYVYEEDLLGGETTYAHMSCSVPETPKP